jgi:hypothetical protein
VLSLLATSGARLAAAELKQSLSDARRVSLREQAQSLVDAALLGHGEGAGLSVVELGGPELPPLIGTGYSADRFTTVTERLTAEPEEGVRIEERLVLLRPAPALPSPLRGAACAATSSAPRVAPVRLGNDVRTLRLYASGNALHVEDTAGGDAIWTGAHPQWHAGVVARVALLDGDADGAVDRVIAADTDGYIWRADLAGPIANWKVTLLAHPGGRVTAAADLVQERDALGRYDAVVVASDTAIAVIRDRRVEPGSGVDGDGGYEGWRAELPSGERILEAPLTVSHTVYFSAWAAGAAATCDDGANQVYAASLASGAPRPLGPPWRGAYAPLD